MNNSRKVSYIHKIFNQLFYGPTLYEEIFNEKSQFFEKPLIDLDDIVLDDNLMLKLKNRFGKKFLQLLVEVILHFHIQ